MHESQNTLYLSRSVSNGLPAMVRNELSKVSPQKQEEFLEEYKRRKKSTGFAYVFWFCLGWHYAYMRKWGLQVLYILTLGGFLIWLIIDFFRIPGLIRNYNKDVAIDVLRNLKAVSA